MTKKLYFPVFCLLLATLLLLILPTDAEAQIYRDTVRLHVLATSDDDEAQAIKLQVRDLLLREYSTALSDCATSDDARETLRDLLPEMEARVCSYLSDIGAGYGATVTLTEEYYETRRYGDCTVPAGTYTSLRVILGTGEGHNWWCVMFPPMCLSLATEDPTAKKDSFLLYSEEEQRLLRDGDFSVKFKLLELLSSLDRS